MSFKCSKCGSNKYTTEKHGTNTGLYCAGCGKWHKWLSNDEIRVYSEKDEQDKTEENTENFKRVINQLKDFTDYLDKLIDRELIKEPLSKGDSIRKCAYCTALERDKNALLNIIDGKDWRGRK